MDIDEVVRKTVQEEVRRAIQAEVLPAARAEAVRAIQEAFGRVTQGEVPSVVVPRISKAARIARVAEALDEVPALGVVTAGRKKGPGPKTFTVQQAAKFLKMNAKTIYFAIKKGKIRTAKIPAPPGMKRGPKDGKLTVMTLDALKEWRNATN